MSIGNRLKDLFGGKSEGAVRGDGQPVHLETGTATVQRQSVEATVHRACRACYAPGTWTSDIRVLGPCTVGVPDPDNPGQDKPMTFPEGWPRVFVPKGCNADGWPVGNKCPNCGNVRSEPEVLGEIWVKEFK
jgi:hypothetical protein